MKLEQAQKIAESLISDLNPYCERIEIGGSIRRKKPDVKDVELICIPKFAEIGTGQTTLFGGETSITENRLFGQMAKQCSVLKMGEKYAQIEVFDEHATGVRQYIKVDVFTATPETWGYIFLIRTGPAEFSKWVVTELKRRGYTLKDGAVWLEDSLGLVQCNTQSEHDVFRMLGIDYIEPGLWQAFLGAR